MSRPDISFFTFVFFVTKLELKICAPKWKTQKQFDEIISKRMLVLLYGVVLLVLKEGKIRKAGTVLPYRNLYN